MKKLLFIFVHTLNEFFIKGYKSYFKINRHEIVNNLLGYVFVIVKG